MKLKQLLRPKWTGKEEDFEKALEFGEDLTNHLRLIRLLDVIQGEQASYDLERAVEESLEVLLEKYPDHKNTIIAYEVQQLMRGLPYGE